MNPSPHNPKQPAPPEPESTLRLLAQLPPPAGLTDRVRRSLQSTPEPARFWWQWMPTRRLQFAGAALVVAAMAVSGWTLYESRHAQPPSAAQAPAGPLPAATPASGLSTAGAERRPGSLRPIKVPPAPRKKLSVAKSHAPKPLSAPPAN